VTYFIDVRAEARGGSPVADVDGVVIRTDVEPNPNPAQPLDAELAQAVQGRDVLLGTHGFHVDRAHGIDYLSHWSEWLKLGDNGFFVGVLWPGDSRWVPYIDYPVEGDEAIKSGRVLADYLISKFSGVNSLSFTSHSLGARTMLEAISNLGNAFTLKTLTVMAAAIDDTCLVNEYKNAGKQMKKISVLASKCDDVLKLAFPEGNLLSGIITRGDPYWHGALGRYGPNPSNQPANLWQTPILPDSYDFGHGSYINTSGTIGMPGDAAPVPPPVVVPGAGATLPSGPNRQQAWAAGFVSTRFP
jgi:hypothetical protein